VRLKSGKAARKTIAWMRRLWAAVGAHFDPQVAVPGEAPQRAGNKQIWTLIRGAGWLVRAANRAGQTARGLAEELRGTLAQLQCGAHESGESRKA